MSFDNLRGPDLLINWLLRQSLWRFRWHGLVLAVALAALLFALLIAVPERYSAVAQVYVNNGSSIERYLDSAAAESLAFTAADLLAESLLDRDQVRSLGVPPRELQIASTARLDNLFRISCVDADRRKAIAAVDRFIAIIEKEVAEGDDAGDSTGMRTDTPSPFRIIEAPVASEVVMPPLRGLWMAVALLLSLAAGMGSAVWLNARNPVIDSAEDIAATVDVPVLATISHMRLADAQSARRRERWLFGFCVAVFLLAGAIILGGFNG